MTTKPWTTITISGHKVKVDREDMIRIEERSWRVIISDLGRPKVVTSMRLEDGVRTVGLGKFLMKPPKGKQVYPRRFQEGLDYRKENLLVCTIKERQRLLPKRRAATSSQYRGVSYQKNSGKWRAGIEVKSKAINLGEYVSEEAAALAYNKAARKFFGKIAYQNSIRRKKKPRT